MLVMVMVLLGARILPTRLPRGTNTKPPPYILTYGNCPVKELPIGNIPISPARPPLVISLITIDAVPLPDPLLACKVKGLPEPGPCLLCITPEFTIKEAPGSTISTAPLPATFDVALPDGLSFKFTFALPVPSNMLVMTLPATTLPVVLTVPAVLMLPPVTLPATTTASVVLSKVNPAEPDSKSLSLNWTCVFEPPASMLPEMLPIKFGAVMLPAAVIVPGVSMLPPVTLPVALMVAAETRPAVMRLLPVTLPVAVTTPAVLMLPPTILPVAVTVPPNTLPPVILPADVIVAPLTTVPITLLPTILPVTFSTLVLLLNVRLALAPRLLLLLNCSSVLDPAAAMLPVMSPWMLPRNQPAVLMLPVADILFVVVMLPVATMPATVFAPSVPAANKLTTLALP